jgi:hypothetical protein
VCGKDCILEQCPGCDPVLADEALHAYCRETGIFPYHLEQWREAFSQAEGGGERSIGTKKAQRLAGGNPTAKTGTEPERNGPGGIGGLIGTSKKVPGVLGGKGRMTCLSERQMILRWIDEAVASAAWRQAA